MDMNYEKFTRMIKDGIENVLWEHEKRISKLEGTIYILVALNVAELILLLKLALLP